MAMRQAALAAQQAEARDGRYVWHPWAPIRLPHANVMVDRARGYRVWDLDGTEFIDASSMNSTCGYAHPEVVAAAHHQLNRLHGVDISVQNHELTGLFAERLASHLPAGLSRTLFTNSGTEGIEASMIIAAGYWSHLGRPRTRMVSFARGYHGSTLLARALSALPPTAHAFASPLRVTHVELPAPAREMRRPESLPPLLEAFAEAIGDDPADLPMAVLVEPLLNVGGGIVLPKGFLRGLRELCDARDVLLIIDEVFTGIGRTGEMFGFQHDGIQPDIVVSSKGLNGGYAPITAVSVQQRIYETFDKDPVIGGLRFGHTTSGHAVGCAVGIATLGVVEKEGLVERARDLGARLLSRLKPLVGVAGVVDVRGLGMVVVIELPTAEAAGELVEAARHQGVLVRQQGSSILVVPPLTIDHEGLDTVAERLGAAVHEGGS